MVEAGQVVSGKYRLLRLLGDGGMGSVFEAEHLALGTRVAIKVLHSDLARRAGIAERFLQEARVSAQIRSAHVVQVTDVDRTPDGVAYLVMELLQGEPLSGLIRRERRLAVGTACEYTSQILQALEAAHALGVIHRDLKPDNVFVTFQGGKPVIKLIDFGIAKLKTAQAGQSKNLTVAGMLMGTPEYMAPEQAYSADKVDVRADLYAVGVMLYEMLSGQAPASADDPRVLIGKVERGEVTPLVQAAPGIEPHLAGFVHRAMAPRPELRFANATEMRITLEEILSGKKWGTAKIPASPVNPAAATSLPPAPAPAAMPAMAPPMDPRAEFRTVMGAPVDAALGSPAAGHRGGTIGGAPIMLGHSPVPHSGSHNGPAHYEPTRPPRKGQGTGVVIVLSIIALLLGAGAVVAYVLSTQQPESAALPFPTATTPVTPSTVSSAVVATPVTPATPLAPATAIAPNPGPGPAPATKKDAGTQPQAQVDAGGASAPITMVDAGAGQTTVVTPFGTFQFPGPRPPFYPADQPWPPPNMLPLPSPR